MKKVFLILVLLAFSFRLWQTTGCKNFLPFKFDPASVKMNVEEAVNTDLNQNRDISRFFHNKASTGLFEITKSYTKVLDTKLLLEILGPIGIVLLILAIKNTFKNANKIVQIHFALLLITPLFVMVYKNPKTAFYSLAFILYSFSLWGLNLKKTNRLCSLLFVLATVATFWYFAFSWQLPTICNEIFFN